jgi:hypothetical protein
MVTKSENGNASVVEYTAYPPPPPPPSPESSEEPITLAATGAGAGSKLTPAQAAMHEKVLEHFQSESYTIPGIKDGELLEAEKFWLVRVSFLSEIYVLTVFDVCSLMTACCGKEVLRF